MVSLKLHAGIEFFLVRFKMLQYAYLFGKLKKSLQLRTTEGSPKNYTESQVMTRRSGSAMKVQVKEMPLPLKNLETLSARLGWAEK